jgi:hypothetical protein
VEDEREREGVRGWWAKGRVEEGEERTGAAEIEEEEGEEGVDDEGLCVREGRSRTVSIWE